MNNKKTLRLADRILINSIFPPQGDYYSLLSRKSIREKVAIKEAEGKKYDIKQSQDGVTWNKAGASASFQYEFTEVELAEIRAALKAKDRDKTLNEDMLNLYQIFAL